MTDALSAAEAERDGLAGQLAKVRDDALHEAAAEIYTFLGAEYAPPIWWRCYDIPHRLAGCEWDDDGGLDGLGSYACEPLAASPTTGPAPTEETTNG